MSTNVETPLLKANPRKPKNLHKIRKPKIPYISLVSDFAETAHELSTSAVKKHTEAYKSGKFTIMDFIGAFVNKEVVTKFEAVQVGCIVSGMSVEHSMFGSILRVSLTAATYSSAKEAELKTYYMPLPYWEGICSKKDRNKIDDAIKIMTDADKLQLSKRGKFAVEIMKSPYYGNHTGSALVTSGWFISETAFTGRVILDHSTAVRVDPGQADRLLPFDRYRSDNANMVDLHGPDVPYHLFWPFMMAFSFRYKKWGLVNIENVTPNVYNPALFNFLVMNEENKHVIKTLVENYKTSVADVVNNKSGGFIFLLHGEPGTGKTLTAEAVAETLQRPLYVVSVGELGITPESLEETLTTILDIAVRWDAVLLIDEADIFLERRVDNDLLRNSMVGVFLRQLEYFSGVLFLTTNRVNNFDKAFYSRISYAIKYGNITDDDKRQIWVNMLNTFNVQHNLTPADIAKLSHFDVNGRQIKNCIRVASTLAKIKDEPLSFDMLESSLIQTLEFTRTLPNEKNFS